MPPADHYGPAQVVAFADSQIHKSFPPCCRELNSAFHSGLGSGALGLSVRPSVCKGYLPGVDAYFLQSWQVLIQFLRSTYGDHHQVQKILLFLMVLSMS
jgi:hypothetical protein